MNNIEYLNGSVERITFYSDDTGFGVFKIFVKGQRDLLTVTGNVAAINIGEAIECAGNWINNTQYGLQFKAQQIKVTPPNTLEGIEKYLGSGLIKGIGAHFAKKLINAFGKEVLEVIESAPDRLLMLEGIGSKRQQQIISSWEEQKSIRNLMIFLQSHQVGTARSARIYKIYGDDAIRKIQENPYCLHADIRGIGFKTADALAKNLGIPSDSILRARAGVIHVLQQLCDHGHCAVALDELIMKSHQLLEINADTIANAIADEIKNATLHQEFMQEQLCIYPMALYQAEMKSAKNLQRLQHGILPWGQIDINKAIAWVETQTNLQLSSSQHLAIQEILQAKLAIITGGPGVGKTTLINSILKILQIKKLHIALCAPTGRAAKRLTETTGVMAKTIHRLLDFDPKTYNFRYNQQRPLPIDLLIIDESSMLDIILLHNLLKAVHDHTAVIFVGDIDQLPSVGSGSVLYDLINSNKITTVRLTEIFRQAATSKIILNAHRVNSGKMLLANDKQSDFFTIYMQTSELIQEKLIQLVKERVPKFYRCNPFTDIQVLTPMNRGSLGSRGLNVALQYHLNGDSEPKITKFGTTFAPKDKVIQVVNNYDKEVFNGDIGFIEQIDGDNTIVTVNFDQRLVNYNLHELDELNLAYAISIHKSQGSEFSIVIMPVSTQHYMLLARNLLYTGITRGKKLVILVAQKQAVWMAINNNQHLYRLTNLANLL